MLFSVSSQHPAQKKSGIAAGVRRERAFEKQVGPDGH